MTRGLSRPAALVPDEPVPRDDVVLTQYGQAIDDPEYRRRPRFPAEVDVSLIEGRLTAEETASLVTHRPGQPYALARWTTAGRLRAQGFIVTRTPTRRNQAHVSVTVPGGDVAWDDLQARRFERAFEGVAFDDGDSE